MTGDRELMVDRRPPLWPMVALVVLLHATWCWMHLVAHSGKVLPLSYALPLLLGLWHRRPWLLWAAALTIAVMGAIEIFGLPLRRDLEPALRWSMLGAGLVNIFATAAVVQAVIVLRRSLDRRAAELTRLNRELSKGNAELAATNEELAAREEEIARQNEELHAQAEELAPIYPDKV